MATQESPKLSDFVSKMRRRRRRMTLAFAAVLVLSLLVAFLWPASYRATGTILIEQQELPPDLVRSAITSFADERIQMISQRVMTTENLLKIIERYDLYSKLRQTAPREKIIKRMRDDISFEMISADVIDPRAGRPTKATIAFSVGYRNRSPELAARVANELVSLYLQVNIETRKQDAANAADFMSDEADRLDKHVRELQASLAAYKQQHLNSLPEQSAINTQLMNHADDELRDVETQLRSLSQQITYLDGQLAQISPSSQVYTSTGERVLSPSDRLKYLRTEYARVSALYAPTHPDVVRLKQEIAGLEKDTGVVETVNDLNRQLEDAQAQLAAARQKYAPDHPDVARLEKQVSAIQAAIQKASTNPAVPAAPAQPDNPAYIELKAQRESAVNQQAALEKKREELKAKLADFEERLAQTPGVERGYMELARELDNAQNSYRLVKQKQLEAQQSKNLEDERKGERFTLIEPPIPPEQPASPNRTAILALGLVLAFAAAFAAMAVSEAMDDSVRNRRDLEALLSVPPLAVLPWIETAAERLRRTRLMRYAAAGMLTSLVLALTLTHFFYRPLDVLWQVALRHLGG
jgi:uncharacterized protein involved in exopolysaccharide biosynthesis